MAKIFKPSTQSRSRKHKSTAKQLADFIGTVTGHDHRGKGIIKNEQGRITFVSGAMLGEQVKVRPITYTDKTIDGECLQVITPSAQRQSPKCEYFSHCGGCQLQYMAGDEQVQIKQDALNSSIEKQLRIKNLPWQAPIVGDNWNYRRTARLVTWFNNDKTVTLGFRQAKSKHIVDIEHCPILVPSLSNLISPIKQLLTELEQAKAISHVQLYHLTAADAIILRQTSALPDADLARLTSFAEQQGVQLILEGDNKVFNQVYSPVAEAQDNTLSYQYQHFNYQFKPNNFIQINQRVNDAMIEQAMNWLDIQSSDTVLDLFSGVGNFTLPLAAKADLVFAVEGVNDMVKQIKKNAQANQLENIKAYQADLSKLEEKSKPQWLKPIDKLLLDPARDGAHAVVKKIPLLKPQKILYVSCNPATMVRDLKVLQDADYALTKIGLLNMFPQTSHVEAMALLELN